MSFTWDSDSIRELLVEVRNRGGDFEETSIATGVRKDTLQHFWSERKIYFPNSEVPTEYKSSKINGNNSSPSSIENTVGNFAIPSNGSEHSELNNSEEDSPLKITKDYEQESIDDSLVAAALVFDYRFGEEYVFALRRYGQQSPARDIAREIKNLYNKPVSADDVHNMLHEMLIPEQVDNLDDLYEKLF